MCVCVCVREYLRCCQCCHSESPSPHVTSTAGVAGGWRSLRYRSRRLVCESKEGLLRDRRRRHRGSGSSLHALTRTRARPWITGWRRPIGEGGCCGARCCHGSGRADGIHAFPHCRLPKPAHAGLRNAIQRNGIPIGDPFQRKVDFTWVCVDAKK